MAIFVAAGLLFRLVKATLCYDASGNSLLNRDPTTTSWTNVTENMCTSGAVTWCCSAADYCFSNGLCIGGGGDNQFQQEGCTSQNWESPCVKYCPGSNYQILYECPNGDTEPPKYCCSPDPTSCCANKNFVSVPVGTLILRPFQLAAIESASSVSSVLPTTSSQSSTAITSTLSVSSDALVTSTSTALGLATSSQSSTGTYTLSLALGLGIPLGISLLAVLFFVGWQLQKYNRLHANRAAVGNSVGSMPNWHVNLDQRGLQIYEAPVREPYTNELPETNG